MKRKTKNMVENIVIVIGGVIIINSIFSMLSVNKSDEDVASEVFNNQALLSVVSENNTKKPITTADIMSKESPKVTVSRTKLNKVEELELEEYIAGVVAAEVPNTFEIEALKAQAVAVRGLTFCRMDNKSKHSKDSTDVCDDYRCCQAYKPENIDANIRKAVEETRGITPMVDGKYAQTLYFASTLEGTISDKDVWGNTTDSTPIYKVLSGPSPESNIITQKGNKYPYATHTISISTNEFIKRVNKVYPKSKLTKSNIKSCKVLSRTKGGYVDKIQLGNITISGSDLRYKIVHELKSANFTISANKSRIVFKSKGYGHGVGLSQWGSQALAKEGNTYDEIIDYYFNDLELVQLY